MKKENRRNLESGDIAGETAANLHTPRRRGTENGWQHGKTAELEPPTNQRKDTNNMKEEEKKKVLTYFKPSELDAMKKDTGADKEGTAVAAFVRKQLAADGANA